MSRLLDVQLENFEGPLDLLIHLIYKNELDIYDIPIALIAEEFMKAVYRMEKLDIEVAAEFITMASYLIYLKSRMLLPKENFFDEEMDVEEEKYMLTQRLVEYSFYKDIAEELKKYEEVSARYLMRLDTVHIPKEEMQTEDAYQIASLFFELISKSETKDMTMEKSDIDATSVRERIREIVMKKYKLMWSDLVRMCINRREIAVSLVAVLELARQEIISADQPELFGDILIEKV